MAVDIGEELVGAYLGEIEQCDHVLYDVRVPGGGLRGLKELDVIGLRFSDNTAYLCEVTIHLKGLLTGKGYESTIRKIREKHEWQIEYARRQLVAFKPLYQFWFPRVPSGLLPGLEQIENLELVVNSRYKERVEKLNAEAAKYTSPTGNMAYRLLQILEHLD